MKSAAVFFFLVHSAVAQSISWLDEPAVLLGPGQQATLRVKVIDAAGATVAAAEVDVTAPVGALIPDDGSDERGRLTVTTGDDGTATITLRGGTRPGPYLVTATWSGASVYLGATNLPSRTAAPVLAASAARRTVESKVAAGSVVYGPVYLPSFSNVTPAGPPSAFSPASSYTTSANGSWLFWVDASPAQTFGHAVEYVIADATKFDASLSTARLTRELWWPMVRLPGEIAVPLVPPLPHPDIASGPCAIAFVVPGSDRGSLAQAVQTAVDAACTTVSVQIYGPGFPQRIARPDRPGGGLGGILLYGATGPADPFDYGEIATALDPLKNARLEIIIQASYAGNAVAALAGRGLNGYLLAGADAASSQNAAALSADLAQVWDATPGAPLSQVADSVVSNGSAATRQSHPISAKLVPDGPRVLPLPDFSLAGPGAFDRATLAIPAGVSAAALQITVSDPRVADIDPRTSPAASTLPPLSVSASSAGTTTYSVRLSGGANEPIYQGAGTITVGQDVSCSPRTFWLGETDLATLQVTAGSYYDPLLAGTKFGARPLDATVVRVTPGDVTLDAGSATFKLVAAASGTTGIVITGTRGFGQPYTACVVDVTVVPKSGDKTTTRNIGYLEVTDAAMRSRTELLSAPSITIDPAVPAPSFAIVPTPSTIVGDVAVAPGDGAAGIDRACLVLTVPKYPILGPTAQAFQKTINGDINAAATCSWSASGAPPTRAFSTFLGGKSTAQTTATALDAQGSLWMVGVTDSPDFPVTDKSKLVNKGDVFIARLSRLGDRVLFATIIGGNDVDLPTGVALDPAGNVYVTGYTLSNDFPVTSRAAQIRPGGAMDGFVLKLNGSTGALVYSTMFGDTGLDQPFGIAVDSAGAAYIAGQSSSYNLPTTAGAYQAKITQSPNCIQAGGIYPCPDAFVAKLSEDGSAWRYVTFLGGSNWDYAKAIAVDAAGNAYVTGGTASVDGVGLIAFPTTAGVVQPVKRRDNYFGFFPLTDAFVSILNPSGTALVASTFLGGDGNDEGQKIAVDPAGNVYITGTTAAQNFPVTSGAFQRTYGGGSSDAFVAAFGPGLRTLLGASYHGGPGTETPAGIALGKDGRVYFSGSATPRDLQ